MQHDLLDAKKIIDTLHLLCLRIEDRFPTAGLLNVARTLHEIAKETSRTIAWIERPSYIFRFLAALFIAAVVTAMYFAVYMLHVGGGPMNFSDFVQASDAAMNLTVLLGAAVAFIVTFETRRKRKRVIGALNRLRSVAHVIDAHQLTKDPETGGKGAVNTRHSPKRTLTAYELGRYLDYCSEMLSLTSKVAFLYVQKFNDPVSVAAVNDLETLTTSLSRKIWQKIALLNTTPIGNSGTGAMKS